MSPTDPPESPVRQALRLLQQNQPTSQAAALLEQVTPASPEYKAALHLRGVCAFRDGDPARARDLYVEAVRHGELSMSVITNLATAMGDAGPTEASIDALAGLVAKVAANEQVSVLVDVLRLLGHGVADDRPGKPRVFEKIMLPLLQAAAARRDMPAVLDLENIVSEWFARTIETEGHFAATFGRMEPILTELGHHWRKTLPPLPKVSLKPPYRVAFFLHNAKIMAHVEVLLNALKGYRLCEDQPFEPVVYCFGGRDEALEAAFAQAGVRLVMFQERFPEAKSYWARLLKLRELVAKERVQVLVFTSIVRCLPVAFGMRIAPVQAWFAMKYRNYSQPDIDGYISGSALTRYGVLAGRRFRMTMLGVDDWYDAGLEGEAARLRAELGDRVVLMTLARTEKMRDPAYLAAMAEILKRHPKAMFLWAGQAESPWVTEAFQKAGVLGQTKFIGWVNTRLWAQVCDVFLDTFPFPCGFTLFQAMAAAKPVVIYDSSEAAQTGLWNFLKPILDDGEGTDEQRAELGAIVGDPAQPLISVARDPQDYVRLAGRLIEDAQARAAGGAASKRFMDRYFSDLKVAGETLTYHLMDLIEERRAAG